LTFVLERRLSLREALLLQVLDSCEDSIPGNSVIGIKPEIAAPRNERGDCMEIGETLYVTTGEDFRRWLDENHTSRREVWLIQYKKAAKKPSIGYVDAVEAALCYGWIDGTQKSMDAERYALRFSPRRPKSNWTETNKERARRLIAEGKMTEAGFATLPSDLKG
jgi:hypothetical protein